MGWFWRNIHRVIGFNRKARLKPYADMNTKLKNKMQKIILRKIFQVDE